MKAYIIDHKTELDCLLMQIRYEKGLTQADLCKDTKISQSKISKIENGLLEPTMRDLLDISEALELIFIIK